MQQRISTSYERSGDNTREHLNLPENLLWNLLESIPMNISIWRAGKIVYANPSFFKDLGVNSGDFKKIKEVTEEEEYFTVHPDDYGIIEKNLQEIREDINVGKVFHWELRMKSRGNEEYRWYNTYVARGKDKLDDITIELDEEITSKKIILDKLNETLKEKEVLLKEVHHRVKNNFQIIASLLRLQQRKITDTNLRDILLESENRVKSMAMVHENLYKSADLSNIPYGDYIHNLVKSLVEAYSGRAGLVKFNIEASDCNVDVEIAIPCSLMINEIVSNSFKHGLDDARDPVINIKFLKSDNNYSLLIKDNGVGFPDSFEQKKNDSLGIMLVTTLSKQLGGSVQFRNNDGAEVLITFPQPL